MIELLTVERMFPDVIAQARELVPEDVTTTETIFVNVLTGESAETSFPGYSPPQWLRFLEEVERLAALASARADA